MKNEIDFEKRNDDLNDLVVEEKKKKRGWLFFLLFLIFIVCIFYAYRVFAPTKGVLSFSNTSNIVYQSETMISGINAKPGSRIKMIINGGNPQFLIADEKGVFSSRVQLEEGNNKIEVSTIESNPLDDQKATAIITYTIRAPKLEITEPANNSEIKVAKGIKEKEITIRGTTDLDAKIKVDGKPVDIDSEGAFETTAKLKLGDNTIDIEADNGKKQATISLSLNLIEETKSNSTPPTVTPNQTPVNNGSSSPPNNVSGNNSASTPSNEPDSEPVVIYPSKVIISYVAYTNDLTQEGYGEYIEIKNTGGEDKDITGWTVSDGDGNSFVFPSYVLSPSATVRITTNTGRFIFNSTSPVWARVGEPGYLRDKQGKLVDMYSY